MWKLATQVRPEEEMDEEDALKSKGGCKLDVRRRMPGAGLSR